MERLDAYAEKLDTAALTATDTPQISIEDNSFTVDEAYQVQAKSIDRRYARGEKRIGIKMGLTSRAKMIQVGVDEVIWGRLTNKMVLEEGRTLSKSKFVHPRIEPEIVFLMKKELKGNVTALEAMDAVEAIGPAMEVIDSRYENFKFALTDVIADNSSSSGLVIGNWHKPDIDISNLGMRLTVNGQDTMFGSSAAILGHPVRSLVSAARMVAQSGETLKPGDIVMAGGATEAHAVSIGETVSLTVQNLGTISITVEA